MCMLLLLESQNCCQPGTCGYSAAPGSRLHELDRRRRRSWNPSFKRPACEKTTQSGEVDVKALRGIDFAVQPGEFVAIMGPSSSGKSTLLHILVGLDDSSEGEVSLAGRRLAQMEDKELTLLRRRPVGVVFWCR